MQGCSTAKKIWETLQVAHEGTTQVKRYRRTLLYSQYENLFTVKMVTTIKFANEFLKIRDLFLY
ncbi:hypothetical protein [Enterobacter hormaechei]